MKKALSVTLALIMLLGAMLCFSGCGGSEKDKFIGTWEASLDLADVINQTANLDASMAQYLTVPEFSLKFQFTFRDNGTYSASIDRDSVVNSFNGLKEFMRTGLGKYFTDLITQNELGITLDDFLTQSGIDMDSLLNEALPEDSIDSMIDEIDTEGKFDVKDGKLFLSDSPESGIDESVYDTYEIDGNTLKLLESHGVDGAEGMGIEAFYPITMKKI